MPLGCEWHSLETNFTQLHTPTELYICINHTRGVNSKLQITLETYYVQIKSDTNPEVYQRHLNPDQDLEWAEQMTQQLQCHLSTINNVMIWISAEKMYTIKMT
jgi:hypothetical protein